MRTRGVPRQRPRYFWPPSPTGPGVLLLRNTRSWPVPYWTWCLCRCRASGVSAPCRVRHRHPFETQSAVLCAWPRAYVSNDHVVQCPIPPSASRATLILVSPGRGSAGRTVGVIQPDTQTGMASELGARARRRASAPPLAVSPPQMVVR
ncbi:hypothetical protein DENSPDRAFT_326149 [Dentipellis sp. KUC8613]|nr:hypothetical protein DENSPDRAFT_326149 [Dentipellis sp. KUC8613]